MKNSFLHESQQFGRANEKVKISIDEAIENICEIRNFSAIEFYRENPSEKWATSEMKIYCHDCREIVPAGTGKTQRGRPRKICGKCGSKKISIGSEKALVQFYHIETKKLQKISGKNKKK